MIIKRIIMGVIVALILSVTQGNSFNVNRTIEEIVFVDYEQQSRDGYDGSFTLYGESFQYYYISVYTPNGSQVVGKVTDHDFTQNLNTLRT